MSSGVPIEALQTWDLDVQINPSAVLELPDVFVIAYVRFVTPETLEDQLVVRLFDRSANRWFIAEVPGHGQGLVPLGTPLKLYHQGGFFYVDTHLTPSAANTLVLDRELTPRQRLEGWIVALLPDEMVLYCLSGPHFRPTYPTQLSLYDPVHDCSQIVYPLEPYLPIRAKYIERVRTLLAAHDRRWLWDHGFAAEDFDNSTRDYTSSADSRTLAFVATFNEYQAWPEDRQFLLAYLSSVRPALSQGPVPVPLPERFFIDFLADVGRLRGFREHGGAARWAELAARMPELVELLMPVLDHPCPRCSTYREAVVQTDARWADPETWKRLATLIATPPPSLEVVYLYENVGTDEPLTYTEIELSQLRSKFSGLSDRAILRRLVRLDPQASTPSGSVP
ncbi:MAG: hypothetical protein ABR961_08750 [Thermoanaerobaculaceae bacterium]